MTPHNSKRLWRCSSPSLHIGFISFMAMGLWKTAAVRGDPHSTLKASSCLFGTSPATQRSFVGMSCEPWWKADTKGDCWARIILAPLPTNRRSHAHAGPVIVPSPPNSDFESLYWTFVISIYDHKLYNLPEQSEFVLDLMAHGINILYKYIYFNFPVRLDDPSRKLFWRCKV